MSNNPEKVKWLNAIEEAELNLDKAMNDNDVAESCSYACKVCADHGKYCAECGYNSCYDCTKALDIANYNLVAAFKALDDAKQMQKDPIYDLDKAEDIKPLLNYDGSDLSL